MIKVVESTKVLHQDPMHLTVADLNQDQGVLVLLRHQEEIGIIMANLLKDQRIHGIQENHITNPGIQSIILQFGHLFNLKIFSS